MSQAGRLRKIEQELRRRLAEAVCPACAGPAGAVFLTAGDPLPGACEACGKAPLAIEAPGPETVGEPVLVEGAT